MLHFYYHAGSEATANAIHDAIRADLARGERVLLLVPEQETVAVERRMLHELPPTAQLSFEVVNFSRLANRTFRELGGHRFRVATPAVRALLMWRTLHDLAPFLSLYGEHAREVRLCDMMLATATRARAYRIGADALMQASGALDEHDPLRGKLSDIATVIGTFERMLAERFDNGDDELDRLAELALAHGKELFSDTHIYVDSFTDFTGQEMAVLAALAQHAASLSFSLPLDGPSDTGLHKEAAARTHRELRRLADRLSLEVQLHRSPLPRPTTAREYVARHLFDMEAEPAPLALLTSPDVTLTLAATPFSQADAAVAEIARLVRGGCRYRDIAVVLRDASSCIGILDAALEREGIPYFLSEKSDVTLRPLVKMLLLALRIHIYGWREEDVVAYAKTGLCGANADDVNLFEEYAGVWHPRGIASYASPFTRNPDGFTSQRSERGERILAAANRARECLFPPLCALHEALDRSENALEMCHALYAFLEALDVRTKLKTSAAAMLDAGNRREAQELSRLFGVTIDALESLAAALGDEVLSVPELLEALRLVFSRTDIGSIPTSADEVTVGSASMLRADRPRHVLVLGLNEGEFPRPVTDDPLLSETECAILADLDVHFPANRAEQSSNELFYLYRAFSAARESLHLFYVKNSADGKAQTPSIAVTRTIKLLGGAKPRVFEREDPADSIYSANALMDRLCDFDADARDALAALLCELRQSAARSLYVPVQDPMASVSASLAETLFGTTHISPSQLEKFSSCHFAYYCARILALREKKSAVPNLLDGGNFVHFVLEQTVKRVREDGGFSAWNAKRSDELVREIACSYRDELLRENSELTPRSDNLLTRLSTLASLVVRSLIAEFSDSAFTPALTEFDLARDGGITHITLEDGKRVSLAGKADRLDLWRSDTGEAFLRVVDYKTGEEHFTPSDVAVGNSLQMPFYLMALCDKPHPALNRALGLPEGTTLTPAGVTYFSSKVMAERTNSRRDEQDAMADAMERMNRSGVLLDREDVLAAASASGNPAIVGTNKDRTLLDSEGFSAMFDDLTKAVSSITSNMKKGDATACPSPSAKRNPCTYCPFGAICRVSAADGKGGA